MPRYGDLDRLMEVIREHDYPLVDMHNSQDRGMFTAGIQQAVDEQPTADVAPVVHGEWLLRHIGHGHYWECSNCHTNPCIYVTENTKFCPNCGAKMDERRNDG